MRGNVSFMEMLEKQWAMGRYLYLDLRPEFGSLPTQEKVADTIFANVAITRDFVCAYGIDIAPFEIQAPEGLFALKKIISGIHLQASGIPIVLELDVERAEAYAEMVFTSLQADAVVISSGLEPETLRLLFAHADTKGILVNCLTRTGELRPHPNQPNENKMRSWGMGYWERLYAKQLGMSFYQLVSRMVTNEWNKKGNCGLVVRAVYLDELREIRKIAGSMPILIPGIQNREDHMRRILLAGRDNQRRGILFGTSLDQAKELSELLPQCI